MNDPGVFLTVPHDEGLKILLVEDNPGDARLIREHLYGLDGLVAKLKVATSLHEALEALADDVPHVVLLDLGLPDATGLEAVEAVIRSCPCVPVVVLTGLEDSRTALEALRSGAQDYMSKNDLSSALLARSLRYAIERMAIHQQVLDAIRARDRILGVVAHDLRNPLNSITMAAELLTLDWTEEKRLAQLQIVQRSAKRMDRLIEDLLEVARIENGRLVLEVRHEDAGAIIREVVESNISVAAANSIRIESNVPDELPPILADRNRVLQVMSNLVGNALKFTPSGGRIILGVKVTGRCVTFVVHDDGMGIPEEDQQHLFEPFWQRRRGAMEGAGLGLAIVKGIVEAHQGIIWVESEVDVGTSMYFSIPQAIERRGQTSSSDLRESRGCEPARQPRSAADPSSRDPGWRVPDHFRYIGGR